MSAPLDEADFVIVGTGAGGATAARVLDEAGFSLALVEEGPFFHPGDRPRELIDAMGMGVRSMATLATDGVAPMPLLQGKCVGGSTAINSGIIWRMPEDVRAAWRAEFGLDHLVGDELDEAFTRIEDELGVGPTGDHIAGMNNLLMAKGAQALGLPGKPMDRNSRGCEGNSRCLQGCPIGARQSMEVSYVPRVLAHGARLHTHAHVDRVLFEGDRAVGVSGVRKADGERERFVVRARHGVIVAASAIFSPVLLRQSGVRHPLLGERFQVHPGSALVGRFDEDVCMGFGASQGYEVPMRERGFKLEALSLPPEMLAARLPGAGARWQRRLAELGHYAQWSVVIRMEAKGSVRPGLFGGVSARFTPTKGDLARVRDALSVVGEMMFAAGAKEVFPGLASMPDVVEDLSSYQRLLPPVLAQTDVHLIASHLFGTVCASRHAEKGVLDEHLAVRGKRGLYVMDASVFPTNLGVNPQHSIMGVVWVAARALAARTAQADRSRASPARGS